MWYKPFLSGSTEKGGSDPVLSSCCDPEEIERAFKN